MTLTLGIDAGGTATRWVLCRDGSELARGAVGGFSGHLFDPAVLSAATRAIDALASAIRPHGTVAAVVAGVTGLGASAPAASTVRDLLATALAVDPAAISVVNDMAIAHRAAFPPGRGILVYAGTGSIACHVTLDGTLVTAGGRGAVIDDGGSAYWIAVQALRRVLRLEDSAPGSGWAKPLGRSLAEAIGGRDWDTVRRVIYSSDRGAIGLLARAVVDADDLFDAAGLELSRLVTALTTRLGPQPVVAFGGVFQLSPRVAAVLGAPVQALDPALAAAKSAIASV